MRCHINRSGFWSKKSVSWCAFFRDCEPIQILSLFWFLWHRRVQTLVEKSGSCLPWLRENGGYKWLLFFLSGLRPCQDLYTLVNGFEEDQSGGAWALWGRELKGECAALEEELNGERPFSWCDFPADFCRTCLARLWPLALSQLTLSFSWCLSDHDAFVNFSGRLWEQQTPVYEVGLPVDMRVKGKFCLSCFCQCLCLSVSSCHNRSQH